MKFLRSPWLWVMIGIVCIAALIDLTHPNGAITSYDEVFHGGTVIYFRDSINHLINPTAFPKPPDYILCRIPKWVVLYPHLWTALGLGALFGITTDVLRLQYTVYPDGENFDTITAIRTIPLLSLIHP